MSEPEVGGMRQEDYSCSTMIMGVARRGFWVIGFPIRKSEKF